MLVPGLSEARRAFTAHHIINALLSLAFLCTKGIQPVCERLFAFTDECTIDFREREILVFLAVIIVWKGRKATNWLHYLSNVFLFSKLANTFLFVRADPLVGLVYVVLCLVHSVAFPEPVYQGPEKITYFQNTELFEELQRSKGHWFILFYTTWSPDCKHVAPIFSQLSEKYTLPNLRFGKLDVGRWAKEAERFRVNAHPTSRQLPTLCCFEGTREVRRRPLVNPNNHKAVPFVFTQENCILEFDLNNIYNESKARLSKADKKTLNEEKKNE